MNENKFFSQNFLVLQLQIMLLLIIFSGFLLQFIDFGIFLLIEIIIAAYFWFLLLKPIKNKFNEQFKYFLLFFGIIFVLVELSWVIQKTIPASNENQLNALFALLFIMVVFAVFYRIVFGRKPLNARIIMSEKNSAVIETDFDIFSFTKAGKYIVEAGKAYPAGKDVKVLLKTAFFKSKPWKIKE